MGSCCETSRHPKSEEKFKLLDYQVPFEFREPFVISGYRRPDISAGDCARSLFKLCNETINVWSHVAAFGFFVFRSILIFSTHSPLDDSFVYPLLAFAVGVSSMFAMSSGAHLFNSMSSKTRHVCFFFDYAAISVYAFSVGQAMYFYSRPLETDWDLIKSSPIFLSSGVVVSFVSTYLCCASRHRWISYKFLIRTGTFSMSFFFNTTPYWLRIWNCSSELDCNAVSIPFFKRHFWFFAVAAFANGSRLPERLIPGVFDFFGQSHHFLHILCTFGAVDEFTAVYLDMMGRRQALEKLSPVPSFANSLFVTLLVLAGNVAIVMWFMFSVKSGETEEKAKVKEN